MDLVLAFIITFALLVLSTFKGIFVAYPLIIGLMLFFILAVKRGYAVKQILAIILRGGKKSLVVIKVLILIGAIISIWMASGTVPGIVYYSVKLIKPEVFILSAFLISCFVSFLIGTSAGTSGTVGIALMVVARGSGVSVAAAAGAIIAGAFFGDRCSPMSSSASLVAGVTDTNIYDNIKRMFRTGMIPLSLSIIFYTAVSLVFPLHNSTDGINNEIAKTFNINMVVLLPALIIIAFSIFRMNVRISMFVSIIAAFLLGIFIQHQTVSSCIRFIIFGYSMDKSNPLYAIIKGGGVIPMLKTCLVVFAASAFAGLIEETEMLKKIESITEKANSRYENFRNVTLTSLFTAAFGCSQTFAVIMAHMLNKKAYEKNKTDKTLLAVDLENTAIMISALIPWNIALLVPMTLLNTNASCMPYLFYIYILPVWNLLFLWFKAHQPSPGNQPGENINSRVQRR